MSKSDHLEKIAFLPPKALGEVDDILELKKLVKDLKEENDRLMTLTQVPKKANPAVVGLAGFGATTLLLQFHNLGWIGLGAVAWLGLVFGGSAQLIAGLMEFSTGNNFGFCAFTSFGAFWITLASILLSNHLKIYEVSETELGAFLLVYTLLTLFLWICSSRTSMALFIVFTLLMIGFVCLDVAKLAHIHLMEKAAGAVLSLCALGAWYCMAHILFLDTIKKNIFPLGKAPYDIIFKPNATIKNRNTPA